MPIFQLTIRNNDRDRPERFLPISWRVESQLAELPARIERMEQDEKVIVSKVIHEDSGRKVRKTPDGAELV